MCRQRGTRIPNDEPLSLGAAGLIGAGRCPASAARHRAVSEGVPPGSVARSPFAKGALFAFEDTIGRAEDLEIAGIARFSLGMARECGAQKKRFDLSFLPPPRAWKVFGKPDWLLVAWK